MLWPGDVHGIIIGCLVTLVVLAMGMSILFFLRRTEEPIRSQMPTLTLLASLAACVGMAGFVADVALGPRYPCLCRLWLGTLPLHLMLELHLMRAWCLALLSRITEEQVKLGADLVKSADDKANDDNIQRGKSIFSRGTVLLRQQTIGFFTRNRWLHRPPFLRTVVLSTMLFMCVVLGALSATVPLRAGQRCEWDHRSQPFAIVVDVLLGLQVVPAIVAPWAMRVSVDARPLRTQFRVLSIITLAVVALLLGFRFLQMGQASLLLGVGGLFMAWVVSVLVPLIASLHCGSEAIAEDVTISTLSEFLEEDLCVQSLLLFCRQEFSTENLFFFLAVQKLHKYCRVLRPDLPDTWRELQDLPQDAGVLPGPECVCYFCQKKMQQRHKLQLEGRWVGDQDILSPAAPRMGNKMRSDRILRLCVSLSQDIYDMYMAPDAPTQVNVASAVYWRIVPGLHNIKRLADRASRKLRNSKTGVTEVDSTTQSMTLSPIASKSHYTRTQAVAAPRRQQSADADPKRDVVRQHATLYMADASKVSNTESDNQMGPWIANPMVGSGQLFHSPTPSMQVGRGSHSTTRHSETPRGSTTDPMALAKTHKQLGAAGGGEDGAGGVGINAVHSVGVVDGDGVGDNAGSADGVDGNVVASGDGAGAGDGDGDGAGGRGARVASRVSGEQLPLPLPALFSKHRTSLEMSAWPGGASPINRHSVQGLDAPLSPVHHRTRSAHADQSAKQAPQRVRAMTTMLGIRESESDDESAHDDEDARAKAEAIAHNAKMRHLISRVMQSGLLRTRSHHLRTYVTCVPGNELVTWLVQKNLAASRRQAVETCLAMHVFGLRHVTDSHVFRDRARCLYTIKPQEENGQRSAESVCLVYHMNMLFTQAEAQVFKLMDTDIFKRYKKSQHYQTLNKQLTARRLSRASRLTQGAAKVLRRVSTFVQRGSNHRSPRSSEHIDIILPVATNRRKTFILAL